MPLLIGTDEAGYGPNLGPLVVTVCVWRIPNGVTGQDLYDLLSSAITSQRESKPHQRLWIADSKQVYKPGGGLSTLERGVLASWCGAGRPLPETWRAVWRALAPADYDELAQLPWYAGFDEQIPLSPVSRESIENDGRRLRDGLQQAQVALLDIRSTAVSAARLNQLLDDHDNKSGVLSHVTLELVHHALRSHDEPKVFVLCDKHGGRNKYARLLQLRFPDTLVQVHAESRAHSLYRIRTRHRDIQFRFQARADTWLPSALASMVSKYLRELAMRAFNGFWCTRLDGLRPTAGYPQDARRFMQAIAGVRQQLHIQEQILWRRR